MTSRSNKAADAAYDILGFRFMVPCVTRWNSHYEAVKKVIAEDSKLPEVCRALGLPALLQADVAFLKEYLIVMAPSAASLDILQGDKHISLGYTLPTLTVLKKRLGALQLRYTEAQRDKLLQGTETHFGRYFEDEEFILAAVSHPLFKLSWIEDADMRAKGTQMLEQAVRDNNRDSAEVSAEPTQTMPTGNTNTAPQLDDFFSIQ